MQASAARIAANLRNAKLSTGPRSTEGKNRSRANSLKHALTARVLRTPEEVAAIGEAIEMPPEIPGSSPFDREFILGEIELIGLRINRAGLMEMRLRDRAALRAEICWEGDRRCEAESIAAAIHRKPAQTAALLEKSPQGCFWLIERWAMLARAVERDGSWDEAARSLAFDLLGTPIELRKGSPGEFIDTEGRVTETILDLAEVARRQVDRLQEIQVDLLEVDAFDRTSTLTGLSEDLGPAGRRILRYEADLQRRLRWYVDLLGENPIVADQPAENAIPSEQPALPAEKEPEVPNQPKAPTAFPLPAPTRHDRRASRVESRRRAAEKKLARKLG